ncbi:B12-binding domain-containing radical SAM protein [Geomonas subterranea]|uniref:B12-binding domain-containing radical SAM protein n=1 Tax=Geomonas subterranea TaxID=2847989 RepID=A0ABX8LLV8_9BACT|nr:radical SAM protein [Geomonas subterranea]QXE92668.1 B12-binding domain-containing radical SAM protein [Geomonas subterranea]QXM09233.1 B12-binding domain-containing radical SAM protein [Geomonas subterranea]
MNILLINPAYFGSGETARERFESRKELIAKGNMYVWPFEPPLGLASLVSFLRAKGVKVSLFDLQAEGAEGGALSVRLRENEPDLVGITVMTTTLPAALALAAEVKALRPNVKVAFGGPHPTVMPVDTLREPDVDYVIRGEGEYPLSQLAERGAPEGIAGLWYKNAGRIVQQGMAPTVPDLNALPMPDYHSFPAHSYIEYNKILRSLDSISMIVSRGCPYQCSFCAVQQTMGEKYRIRDPRTVVEEMRYLQREFGIEGIWFKDSIFNLRKKWVAEFCDEIRRTGLDMRWQINTRVDLVDEREVAEMARAGLVQIDLGIESGSSRTLKTLRKDTSLETIEKSVAAAKRHVRVSGFFMVGVPGETVVDIDMTFDLARRLDLDKASWSIFTPLPGSQLYRDLLVSGRIPAKPDWTQTHFIDTELSYADMPHWQLKERFAKIQNYFCHT